MLSTRRRTTVSVLLVLAALGVSQVAVPTGANATQGGKKSKSDKELFQGKWQLVSVEKGGEKIPDEFLKEAKVAIKGNKIIIEALGETKEATYKLDPSKKPRAIDLTMDNMTVKGIYEFTKDKLKICAAADANGPRPKSFKSEEGTFLVVLKRFKAEKKNKEEKKDKGARKSSSVSLEATGGLAEECSQQGALKTASANNLKVIGLAMHNYHDTYRSFPAAAIFSKDGRPLLSWRVAILPYIEQGNLYRQFKLNESWDSPHNKKLLDKMPKVYAPVGADAKPNSTFYRVFTGQGTMFEGKTGQRIGGVTDGLSNTILVVEAGAAVPWTKPDELPYDAKKPLPKLGGMFKEGFNALFADGAVHFLRSNANPQILRAAITRNDGQALDLDKLKQ